MNILQLGKSLFSVTLCLTLYVSYAQKPVPVQEFEIRLTNTEEASYHKSNMRVSAETDFPLAIYNPAVPVTANEPEQMAREYLQNQQELLGLTDSDLENLQLHAIREGKAGTVVRLRQYWQGLPVNKAEITVTINPAREVSFVMNGFRYGIDLEQVNPAVDAATARAKALNYLNPGTVNHEEQELKILHHHGTARLIYEVIIASQEPQGEWEIYVDAQTGELIKVEDVACYYHDHREQTQPGLPPASIPAFFFASGTGNVFNPDPLSSANAEYGDTGFSDNGDNNSTELLAEQMSVNLLDITFDGSDYSLSGPYAEVQDFEAPNNGTFDQSSNTWNFDRQDAAFEAVNTYYHIDASMRYLNVTLGITVSPTDYSTGVRFDPHGLNGADNSYYSGSQQRLAFGEGGVDDAEDSDVIHHELGHGLHDWITNGGLSQVNGLSEGTGDYWAASYNRSLGLWDPSDDAYHWVFIWDGHNEFWNGRSVDYTPGYPGGLTGFIHTDGQIWATCMMSIWDDIGKTMTDEIFWEGLAMTNGSSSQDDAANAVYQAALDLSYPYTALEAIHDRMTNTGYNLPALPLPVELSSFTGKKVDQQALLSWTTASEENNDYFTLERSSDGRNFSPLAEIEGQGTSFSAHTYEYLDQYPLSGTNFYRLKQTDLDGSFSYSAIVALDFRRGQTIQVYPNPVTGVFFIQSELVATAGFELEIIDASGRILSGISYEQQGDDVLQIDLRGYPAGMYYLRCQTNKEVWTEKFLKE